VDAASTKLVSKSRLLASGAKVSNTRLATITARTERCDHGYHRQRTSGSTPGSLAGQRVSPRPALLSLGGRDIGNWTDEHEAEPLVTVRSQRKIALQELMELYATSRSWTNLRALGCPLAIDDNADDSTIKLMESVTGSACAIRQLAGPFPYPEDSWKRWLIVGAPAVSASIELLNGFVDRASTDDDIEVMLLLIMSRCF